MALEIPWVIEEHTKVKHQILESYVTVWMAIMFSQQTKLGYKQKLIYIDGFAGPGVYWSDDSKREEIWGSPVIIAQKANEFIEKDKGRELLILGIDKEKKCIESLQKLLDDNNKFKQKWHTALGEFEGTINKILDNLEEAKGKIAPSFFFIDPFGYSGFSMATLKRILRYPRMELFINLNVYDINRFLEAEHACQSLNSLYGTDKYIDAAKCEGDKKISFLMELYCAQLKDAEVELFVQPFRINTTGQGTRPRYFLIHVSQNIKALKEMKNAMSKISTQPFRFEAVGLDPSRQLDLFELSGEEVLRERLIVFINASKDKIPYDEIEDWAYQATSGVAKEIKSALVSLEKSGEIKVLRKPGQKHNTVTTGAMVERIRKE